MSVSRGILKDKYNKPEPYFYCCYGGIGPICSDCKRNHNNTRFITMDITTWYRPNVLVGGMGCSDYIKISDK